MHNVDVEVILLLYKNLYCKYRKSTAFGNIYTGGHFSVAREGESHKDMRKSHKSLFVVVLNITLCSLDVNISAVHTTALDKEKGQERR